MFTAGILLQPARSGNLRRRRAASHSVSEGPTNRKERRGRKASKIILCVAEYFHLPWCAGSASTTAASNQPGERTQRAPSARRGGVPFAQDTGGLGKPLFTAEPQSAQRMQNVFKRKSEPLRSLRLCGGRCLGVLLPILNKRYSTARRVGIAHVPKLGYNGKDDPGSAPRRYLTVCSSG